LLAAQSAKSNPDFAALHPGYACLIVRCQYERKRETSLSIVVIVVAAAQAECVELISASTPIDPATAAVDSATVHVAATTVATAATIDDKGIAAPATATIDDKAAIAAPATTITTVLATLAAVLATLATVLTTVAAAVAPALSNLFDDRNALVGIHEAGTAHWRCGRARCSHETDAHSNEHRTEDPAHIRSLFG
jgi:hypothetical protein